MLRFRAAMVLAALLLLGAFPAPAITIDFENFAHGDVIAFDQAGYTLTADNFNKSKPDAAIAFDAASTERKKLSGLDDLGNILVLQDPHCKKGSCTNDWHSSGHSSGVFEFAFDESANAVSFDLIGFNRGSIKKSSITFFDGSTEIAKFALKDLIDKKALLNHVELSTLTAFDSFEIRLKASGGGLDNIVTGGTTAVPEPGTAGLVALGLGSLAYAVRRRR
jgi:hypothetical protein